MHNEHTQQIIEKYFGTNIYIDFAPLGFPFDREMWPLENKFPADKKTKHIVFQDNLTWKDSTCLEIEWYQQNIPDIHRYYFYVPHWKMPEFYPHLNMIYHNHVLHGNACAFRENKHLYLHYFENPDRSNDEKLCLMRQRRHHRILIYNYLIKEGFANLNISLQQVGIEPKYPGIEYNNYWCSQTTDRDVNVHNFISLVKNYQQASTNYLVETSYFDPYSFITEKTIQPFLAKQAVVPLCQKNYCKHLQYYGFNVDYLDTAFDKAENDERFQLALALNPNPIDPYPEYNQRAALDLPNTIVQKLDQELQLLVGTKR